MIITGYESSEGILNELGIRIRDARISMNYTQSELAEMAGISLATVVRAEKGASIGLNAMIEICRVLRVLENFNLLLPEYHERPTDILEKKPKRQRASKAIKAENKWKWGEDK